MHPCGVKTIGFDMGTTFSCIGVWQLGRVEIILNDHGNNIERLIADAAKNHVVSNFVNTIFDARRLVGRRFSDVVVQSDIQHCPFKVVASPLDKPMIVVSYKSEKRFVAEEISVMVIRKMREVAEAFLGITVKNAMATVPA